MYNIHHFHTSNHLAYLRDMCHSKRKGTKFLHDSFDLHEILLCSNISQIMGKYKFYLNQSSLLYGLFSAISKKLLFQKSEFFKPTKIYPLNRIIILCAISKENLFWKPLTTDYINVFTILKHFPPYQVSKKIVANFLPNSLNLKYQKTYNLICLFFCMWLKEC